MSAGEKKLEEEKKEEEENEEGKEGKGEMEGEGEGEREGEGRGTGRVLVVVNDERTCYQLKQVGYVYVASLTHIASHSTIADERLKCIEVAG